MNPLVRLKFKLFCRNQTKELKENNTKMRSELGELEKLPPTSEIPIVQSQLKKKVRFTFNWSDFPEPIKWRLKKIFFWKWMELQSRLAALETDDPEDREKEKVDLKTPEEISKLDLMIEKYRTLWLDHRKMWVTFVQRSFFFFSSLSLISFADFLFGVSQMQTSYSCDPGHYEGWRC